MIKNALPAEAVRHGPQPNHRSAHDLNRPSRVQELLLVTVATLNDTWPDAQVGKHFQSLQHARNHGHETEGLGKEEMRKDEVRHQSQHLTGAVAHGQPHRGLGDFGARLIGSDVISRQGKISLEIDFRGNGQKNSWVAALTRETRPARAVTVPFSKRRHRQDRKVLGGSDVVRFRCESRAAWRFESRVESRMVRF